MPKPKPPQTQLERAQFAVSRVVGVRTFLANGYWLLDAVLDEAQNQPPLGKADGSISVEEWNRLSQLRKSLRELLEVLPK